MMEPLELSSNIPLSPNNVWEICVDGSSNPEGPRVGAVIASPEGIITKHGLCLEFSMTNNEADYEPLIVGLNINKKLRV